MASWQNKLLKLALRTRARLSASSELDVAWSREQLEKLSARAKTPDYIHSDVVSVAHMMAEWLSTPQTNPENILLYLHGGAYCLGSVDTHRTLAGRITHAAQARTLLVNYRLAPEHPFPAALEDATAAYRWLLAQGYAPHQIALGGDSAGGGLTLATLLALRDAGDPLPATAVCLSPWTDLAGTGESVVTNARSDPWLEAELLTPVAQLYLADTVPQHPLASPLYGDLAGLPPLFIQVGTAEILLSDAIRFAEKAQASGVEVTLEVWEGMVHVWQAFAHLIPEGRLAIAKIGRHLCHHLAQPEQEQQPVVAA